MEVGWKKFNIATPEEGKNFPWHTLPVKIITLFPQKPRYKREYTGSAYSEVYGSLSIEVFGEMPTLIAKQVQL